MEMRDLKMFLIFSVLLLVAFPPVGDLISALFTEIPSLNILWGVEMRAQNGKSTKYQRLSNNLAASNQVMGISTSEKTYIHFVCMNYANYFMPHYHILGLASKYVYRPPPPP